MGCIMKAFHSKNSFALNESLNQKIGFFLPATDGAGVKTKASAENVRTSPSCGSFCKVQRPRVKCRCVLFSGSLNANGIQGQRTRTKNII